MTNQNSGRGEARTVATVAMKLTAKLYAIAIYRYPGRFPVTSLNGGPVAPSVPQAPTRPHSPKNGAFFGEHSDKVTSGARRML